MDIGRDIVEFVERARVARLATIDSGSIPHLVPVVFVFDGSQFFLPIDEKKKAVGPEELKRVKNIRSNPNVCLLIDEYSDDWTKLSFVMIQGRASVTSSNDLPISGLYEKLVARYPQYRVIGLSDVWIVIRPQKVVSWHSA